MLKNILVPLTGFENDARALEAANIVGWPFSASIEALHVRPEAMELVVAAAVRQFGSRMGNRELIHALEKEAAARAHAARTAFDAFYERHFGAHAYGNSASGVVASWREIEGNPVEAVVSTARFADLLVLARAPEHGQYAPAAIANFLVNCGRPLLLAPNAEVTSIGHTIAIAWKETAEAARAVTAAMPLLLRAKKVLVLSVAEGAEEEAHMCAQSADRLGRYLARHGIPVETRGLKAATHGAPQALLHEAKELNADLLVAGAFSHSRVREIVLGGFTREMLDVCDLPLFLLH